MVAFDARTKLLPNRRTHRRIPLTVGWPSSEPHIPEGIGTSTCLRQAEPENLARTRALGDPQENPRRLLGDPQETLRRRPGDPQETPGNQETHRRPLEIPRRSTGESRRPPGNPQETPAGDPQETHRRPQETTRRPKDDSRQFTVRVLCCFNCLMLELCCPHLTCILG